MNIRLFCIVAFLSVNTVFGEGRSSNSPRIFRVSRNQPQTAALNLPPETAKVQLAELAAKIKTDYKKISEKDLQHAKQLLAAEVVKLRKVLPAYTEKKDGAAPAASGKVADFTGDVLSNTDWVTELQLNELQNQLKQSGTDLPILETVQNALYSGTEGVRWTQFDALRAAVRRYRNFETLLKNGSYDKQFVNVLDNLPQYIDKYNADYSPLFAGAITDAVGWLDDVSLIEPRTAELSALVRAALSGINVKVRLGSDFVKAGFERQLSETMDIDENIDGTHITGTGTITGKTSAELAPSPKSAAIRILVNAVMESNTDGVHKPVKLKTHTSGTITGEKMVEMTADGITTKPAKAKADLDSAISNVQVDGCRLVKKIAKGQVEKRKPEAEAKAEQRAAGKMSKRLDDEAGLRFAELNERYQTIRDPLCKTGLFPKVWSLTSTDDAVNWAFQIASPNQPSAPVAGTADSSSVNGLFVQVHQSSINNIAATLLSDRIIDEEQTTNRLKKYFKETPKFLERNSEVSPAKVSFGAKAPVDVLFKDNKIKVVVRLNDIEVLNSTDKSYIITVEYQIKTDGGRIILEQLTAEAFPSTYKPGARLSTVQTIIRSYLMKRLEVFPKQYEASPLQLGGEWKGELVPVFMSAENGWLTLAWNWK